MSGGDGCPICEALGLEWSVCEVCGIEFPWEYWFVETDDELVVAVPAEDRGDRPAYLSPVWLVRVGDLVTPSKCEQCSGGVGYWYQPEAFED